MKNKQFKLSILALSIVATFSANVALAGNIQASSVAIAREAIASDLQSVSSPLITYSFQGAVDASTQAQTFQVQLQLTEPATATAIAVPIINAITKWNAAISPALDTIQLRDAAFPAVKISSSNIGYSADGKTIWATFSVPAGTPRIQTPVVVIGSPTTAAAVAVAIAPAAQVQVVGLATVSGVVAACDTISKQLSVTVKHFTAVTSPTTMADGVLNGVADEHTRAGSNNNGTLITFPTNIKVAVAASTGTATLDVVSQNTRFLLPADGITTMSATAIKLGNVIFSNQSNGYDVNLLNAYSVLPVAANVPSGAPASLGVVPTAVGAANGIAGNVEALNATVVVTGSSNFPVGANLFLAAPTAVAATECVTPLATQVGTGVAGTAPNAVIVGNVATITLSGAGLTTAASAAGANICYTISGLAGNVVSPSTFSALATLTKATGGTAAEQNNSCSGPLFTLGGGVKIDVRNYATAATAGGWSSTLRIINPSETQSGRIFAQLIHADGSYGNWGELTTAAAPLKARGSMNLGSLAINALLINAPVTNGVGYVAGVAAPVANVNGAGDRLRITADGITSLRVQNYLYNPATMNFIEASSDQGVDFDAITNRSPDISQTISQDAQRGLAK